MKQERRIMKTFIPEKIKKHRKIRRNIGVSLLSFILALSFVFVPMSEASVTETKKVLRVCSVNM